MALGADMSLPSKTQSPLRGNGVPAFGAQPPMVNDNRVSDQRNNLLAGSAGAGRVAMQGMDRAGLSRGRGQQLRSDMAQAGADIEASSAAQQTEMGAANANRSARQSYENTMRGEQLANAGLLENLRSNNVRERLAKQGLQQDMYEAMRRGQFGLDSIYLDKTPLIEALLRQGD